MPIQRVQPQDQTNASIWEDRHDENQTGPAARRRRPGPRCHRDARAKADEVEVLHWWTSGGEAAALNVLKKDLEKPRASPGRTCRSPAAAATQAMTVLRARVTAGKPPDRRADARLRHPRLGASRACSATSNDVAAKEGWDKVVPTALQKLLEI